MSDADLIDRLPTAQRLALAYSSARARPLVLTVLALDTRLASIVRSAREPVLAQLRLAWWREALGDAAHGTLRAEPLLGRLTPWRDDMAALVALVDGWEALMASETASGDGLHTLAAGRGAAFAALASVLGEARHGIEAERAATEWAIGDLAARLDDPGAVAAQALAAACDWKPPRLPRALRTLVVLHGLARRAVMRGQRDLLDGPGALLTGIRLGLLGR